VALRLSELLNYKVVKISDRMPDYSVPQIYFLDADITKQDCSKFSEQIKPRDILFLETSGFTPEKKKNDAKFSKLLSSFGDVFVEEAFSAAHRKEASTYGLAETFCPTTPAFHS